MSISCNTPSDRRKFFWSTKPDACGTEKNYCDNGDCSEMGFRYITDHDAGTRTIEADEYVESLALNMLGTNHRREDTNCGVAPSGIQGHWSETFAGKGYRVGSKLRYLPTAASVNVLVAVAKAAVEETLEKLVALGVASSIEVTAKYAGGAKIAVDAVIYGTTGTHTNVAVSGAVVANEWIWSQQ